MGNTHCRRACLCSELCKARVCHCALVGSFDLQRQGKVSVKRDSKDEDLPGAYRQVVKKVHPVNGADKAKFPRLQAAKEAWAAECQKSTQVGAPATSSDDLVLSKPSRSRVPRLATSHM